MERVPAEHLVAWYSCVTLDRSLPTLGPSIERVGDL